MKAKSPVSIMPESTCRVVATTTSCARRRSVTRLGGVLLLTLLVLGWSPRPSEASLNENERVKEYHARNYTWPIEEFHPKTPGWKRLFEHRLRQVTEIDNKKERYEGFIQVLNAGVLAPNFTEFGFGLARAPEDLMIALRQGIRDGLEKGPREEKHINVIEGDHLPWFIDRPDLTDRVLDELQHYPETWANIELTPHNAYGFRLYRNNSRLQMHIDKSQTHVISFILHIDSSEDAEPWPILIEDFHGYTHEIVLTSGDILFYESSKCFHGRPKRFNGSWYSSVFVHYYPKYGWEEQDHALERHYTVPPNWAMDYHNLYEIPLKMTGTGLSEPTCPHEWCNTEQTIRWSGPGKEGYWIAPNGDEVPFDPKPLLCQDLNDKCETWANWESDECKNNAEYMTPNCPKSCGLCTAGFINSDAGHSEL